MTKSRRCPLVWFGSLLFALIGSAGAVTDRCRADAPLDAAAAQYASANGLLHRGLHDLAAREFRSFLADHAGHEKANLARYGLGVCCQRLGKPLEAMEAMAPLIEASGFEFRAEALTLFGHCALEARDFGVAATRFESVAREFPTHELADDALAGAAEALYQGDKPAEAAAWARRLLESHSTSPLRVRAAYFLGLSEMRRERYAEAAAAFRVARAAEADPAQAEHASVLLARCLEFTGEFDEAATLLEKASRNKGGGYAENARLALARLRYQSGRALDAARELDFLLEGAAQGETRQHATLLRARLWLEEGEYAKALAALDPLSAVEGLESALLCEAEFLAAKCRLRQENFADAAERLERAIRRHRECGLAPAMRFDFAYALFRGGHPDRAEAALSDWLSESGDDPLAPEALHLLAFVQHQRRRFHESAATCGQFLANHAGHELEPSVAFLYAEDEFLLDRFVEAGERYRAFLARHAKDERAPRARFRLASSLLRLGRAAEAETLLRACLDGDDVVANDARHSLGDLCFDRGDWTCAEEHLTAYLARSGAGPGSDDPWLRLGLARQRRGDEAGALKAFDELLSRRHEGPHAAQAMFEKGQLLATTRPDEAPALLERAMEADREGRLAAPALNHLGALAARRGDLDAAAGYYARAARLGVGPGGGEEAALREAEVMMRAERFEDAEKALQSLIDSGPSKAIVARARLRLGVCQSRAERCAEAVQTLGDAMAGLNDDGDRALLLSGAHERAWCLRELNRTDEARKAYAELIALEEEGAGRCSALFELAMLESEAGRHEAAVDLLQKAMVAGGGSPELLEQAGYRIAVGEFELGRFREAADRMEAFLVAHPGSALVGSASYFAGEANSKLGRAEAAAAHFERAARDGGDAALREAAILRLGESLAEAQQWARSEQVMEGYLSEFPASPHLAKARFGIGWAREHQKRYDEAITAYRAVTERHQGSTAARAQFQIGECLFAQKRYEDAARELLKVDILYAYPEWSAAALFEAGRCLELLNKSAEAREQFRAVRERHGDTKWAELAGRRLSEMSSIAPTPGRQGS